MADSLRVVFAGTPENAAAILTELHTSGVHIVGVLTRHDSLVGRAKQLKSSAVAQTAEDLGIPLYKSNSIGPGVIDWLKSLKADVGAVVAYGAIFEKEMLETPRLGWINLHFSLLPELPGPAPVQNALLLGRPKTGVTVFRLDEGIDTGPIVSQEVVSIKAIDNAGTLLAKLTNVGSELLGKAIIGGESVIVSTRVQESTGNHVYAAKPTRDLAKLDFSDSAVSQVNKVRAMNPEPMAWFNYNVSPVRVLSARAIAENNIHSSEARMLGKDLVVGCGQESIVLEIVQPAGKQQMSGADWFRGLRLDKTLIS